MSDLLNEIIARGGTTAHTEPVTKHDLLGWMRHHAGQNAWVLAEDSKGALFGFQWIEPKDELPPDTCDISTFTRVGHTRLGCGSALFETTVVAARKLGYRWINAEIRADNDGALAYYGSRGFESYGTKNDVRLANGIVVNKVLKRFEL